MATTYALLVGIDEVRAVTPLRCRGNDVARRADFLRARHGHGLSLEELCDETGTKAAVIDTFRRHLGQVGPGETARYWFSGHGCTAAVPPDEKVAPGTSVQDRLLLLPVVAAVPTP